MKYQIIGINHDQFTKGFHEHSIINIRGEDTYCIYVPEIFIPHITDTKPYQIWRGSRFSAKSWTKALQFLYKADTQKYFRGVFARITQKAARESQFQLFKDLLNRYQPLKDRFIIGESSMTITHKYNGNYMLGGSFEQADTLMSIPDITDFWSEEPITRSKSIKRKDFQTIEGTLRNASGMPSVFHFTFNPISQENWIYEDYYSSEKVYTVDEVNDLHVNWYDNPFCPEDRVEYLQRLKRADPDRYQVDGEGEWGASRTGLEYYFNFERSKHVKETEVDAALPIHIDIDFNVVPYMSAKVSQMRIEDGRLKLKYLKEYALEPPKSNTTDIANAIITDFEYLFKNGVYLYGDASGKNRIPIKESSNMYEQLRKDFKGILTDNSFRINRSNLQHLDRSKGSIGRNTLMNRVLSGEYPELPIDVEINPSMKLFIKDLEQIQNAADGSKAKYRVTDKVTKASYEELGHMSDGFDYLIQYIAKNFYGV